MYTLDANIFLRDLNTNDPDYLECHALLAQLEATATPVIVPLVLLAEVAGSIRREVHERTERGEALAADQLSEIAARIHRQYTGPDVIIDETAQLFWASLPHFYMNFYVYKYATGISAGMALAHQILTEGQPAVDRYLTFLRSGGSQDSIVLLQQAGVDMTTPKPVAQVLHIYDSLVDQLEALV